MPKLTFHQVLAAMDKITARITALNSRFDSMEKHASDQRAATKQLHVQFAEHMRTRHPDEHADHD